jgi:hypothetical protein
LLEELPETDNFDIIKYWCSSPLSYPLLSKITSTGLCIACRSLDQDTFNQDIDSIKNTLFYILIGDIGVFGNY